MDLKVKLVSHVYPYPCRGFNPGIERLVEGIAEALVKRGVEASVVTSSRRDTKSPEITPAGVSILRVKSLMDYKYTSLFGLNFADFSFRVYKKFLPLLRESDIIHCFTASFIPLKPLKSLLPPILSYFPHLDRPRTFKEFLYRPAINFLLSLIYKCSDLVLAGIPPDSPEIQEFLNFFRIPLEKVRFTYEGVDISKFNSKVDGSKIKSKFGDNIILYVGPFYHRKGLIYLIKAATKITREVPDVKFIFVGGDEQLPYLKRLSKQLKVDEYIYFAGFVPDEQLPKYYAAADVFAFPSLKEGYPLVCLEAMACGTPVVATNLSPIRTIVGSTGILTQPRNPDQIGEGIVSLLKNPTLRKKLGKRAEKRVLENFTWEKVVEELMKIYSEF